MSDRAPRGTEPIVEAAIDRTVREMIRVEPPAGTRARVLSRIEQPPRPLLPVPRFVAAAALAAAVVLAFVLTRGPAPAPAPAPAALAEKGAEPPVQSAPPVPPPAAVAMGVDGARDVRGRGARRSREARSTPADLPVARFTSTIAIAPLKQIEPIVVAPLPPPRVAPGGIVIAPLAPIAELEIEPLFPSDGRS